MGQRIAALRRERGWTQEKLGERLKIASKNVQRLERGQNLTLVTLATVARALGVEPSHLLERDEAASRGWLAELGALGFEFTRRGPSALPVFTDLQSESRGETPLGWVNTPAGLRGRGDLALVQLPANGGWCLLGRAEGDVAGRRLLLLERTKDGGQVVSCEAQSLELDASQRPALLALVGASGRAARTRSFVLGDEVTVIAELVRAWPAARTEH